MGVITDEYGMSRLHERYQRMHAIHYKVVYMVISASQYFHPVGISVESVFLEFDNSGKTTTITLVTPRVN